MKLSELYFGDLEAFDEARNEKDYFNKTFVSPQSMNMSMLKNNRRFILVGRKGVGKTAVQMHLASELETNGYFTNFFRFSEDLRSDDYQELSRTQTHISMVSLSNPKKLFLAYDFRDVWERVIFNRIAAQLIDAGHENNFTKFVAPQHSKFASIFSGIAKSLTVKLSADLKLISAEVGFDTKQIQNEEMSLKQYNMVARELFVKYCAQFRMYFFVDELVFSKLDAADDEIRIRAAMVRDIVKTCRELNNLAAQSDLDFHFICTLRPEIRNLINSFDSEIGKIIDGRDVALTWYLDGEHGQSLIYDVFTKKIQYSAISKSTSLIEVEKFVTITQIGFGQNKMTISEYLKTNTWGRPRDVVRLLLSVAKMNPNAETIDEEVLKNALGEYSRASAKELLDELGVSHGQAINTALKKGIRKKTYNNIDELINSLPLPSVNKELLANELFEKGLVQGYDKNGGNYFSAQRGDTGLKPHHKIRIHRALWNEFGIRSAK